MYPSSQHRQFRDKNEKKCNDLNETKEATLFLAQAILFLQGF